MTKVAIYARPSGAEQRERRVIERQQLGACRDRCAKNGHEVGAQL